MTALSGGCSSNMSRYADMAELPATPLGPSRGEERWEESGLTTAADLDTVRYESVVRTEGGDVYVDHE